MFTKQNDANTKYPDSIVWDFELVANYVKCPNNLQKRIWQTVGPPNVNFVALADLLLAFCTVLLNRVPDWSDACCWIMRSGFYKDNECFRGNAILEVIHLRTPRIALCYSLWNCVRNIPSWFTASPSYEIELLFSQVLSRPHRKQVALRSTTTQAGGRGRLAPFWKSIGHFKIGWKSVCSSRLVWVTTSAGFRSF